MTSGLEVALRRAREDRAQRLAGRESPRAGRGALGWLDLIPLAYWALRYRRSLPYRVLLIDGFVLVAWWALAPVRVGHLLGYVVLRVVFICVSEIGYVQNDRDLIQQHRPGRAGGWQAAMVVSRLAAVGLLAVVAREPGPVFAVAGATFLLVMAHNWVLRGSSRAVTIAGLYGLRYSLPLLASPMLALWPYAGLAAPAALGWTAKYMRDKGRWPSIEIGFWTNRALTFITRAGLVGILGVSLLSALAGPWSWTASVWLAVFLIGVDLLITAVAVVRVWARATAWERTEWVHLHTDASHDSDNLLADMVQWARVCGIRRLWITDHAEDVDGERWAALCRAAAEASTPEVDVTPGLEFAVAKQHVLALGLDRNAHPPDLGGNEAARLKAWSRSSEGLVWAHPHFAIRRLLFEAEYRRSLGRILRAVHGIEVVNHKSTRRFHHRWRHVAVALWGVVVGHRVLTAGLDAHVREDFPLGGRSGPR